MAEQLVPYSAYADAVEEARFWRNLAFLAPYAVRRRPAVTVIPAQRRPAPPERAVPRGVPIRRPGQT